MLTPRAQFLNQFTTTILVQGTQGWQFRLIEPPLWLPGSLYDAMCTCAGSFSVTREQFHETIWPLVVLTHAKGRAAKARRPDASDFADRLYDLLSAAGIEVTIRPPVEAHGHKISALKIRMHRVKFAENLHTMYSHGSHPLGVYCRKCHHRDIVPVSALSKETLKADMTELRSFKFKCKSCSARGTPDDAFVLYIFSDQHGITDFLAGEDSREPLEVLHGAG